MIKRILIPVGAGLLGGALLAGIYIGLVSLAESPARAVELFWEDRWYVIPILFGFSTQVGLYTFLKKGFYLATASQGGVTTTASGGMSTVAMVACCAHRVADVLPFLGLTSAAMFLAEWKIPFLIVGLLSNLFGIGVMVREILKARRLATTQVSV
jgi:hypothetical protein